MPALWIAVVFCCALLAGCQPAIPHVQDDRVATIDEPFELQPGQTASLADANLKVAFESVLSDGRCPTNIECAATIPVYIVLKVGDRDSQTWDRFTFHSHTLQDGTVIAAAPDTYISDRFGGFVISLMRVTPYPDAHRETAVRDYRIELVVSEQAGEDSEPTEGISVGLNDPFDLTLGEQATLDSLSPQEALALTFARVVDDSRCPRDVMCAWSGVVNVEMVAAAHGMTTTFTVGGVTDYAGIVSGPVVAASGPTSWTFDGYVIDLERVLPYPVHEDPPRLEEYVATLAISRAQEPLPTATSTAASSVVQVDENGR